MENKSTYERFNKEEEISDKTHFKNKFMSFMEIAFEIFMNVSEILRSFQIDDEEIDWNGKTKSFSLFLCVCGRVIGKATSGSIGEDKWNGDLQKLSTDNGIIYDTALDSNERWNIYYFTSPSLNLLSGIVSVIVPTNVIAHS